MAESSRKKIQRNIERALWAKSGGLCMNPDCNQEIIEVGANSLITATFEIAHIYPHSEGGPRYQYPLGGLTDRDSLDNLLVLCLNCHQKVNSHPEQFPHTYPPELLISWKKQHKDRISSVFKRHLDLIQSETGLTLASDIGLSLYPGQKGLQSKIFERHNLFGGREVEFNRLNAFLHDKPNGYQFITGPSGFGKTALVANWIRYLESNNQPVVYHFISRVDELADESSTFLDLCEQLAAYQGFQGELHEEPKKLRALFPKLLGFPPGEDEKLVIVLDGLDEATDWKPISRLFPNPLAQGVYFIFSAREIAGQDWLAELELPKNEAGVLRLETLDLKGIDSLVRNSGEKAAWACSQENLTIILDHSKGDPFYLQYLVKDIVSEVIRDQVGLKNTPDEVNKYLKNWWKREISVSMDEEMMEDLVGYLAVARGRLAEDDLIHISPTDKLNGATVDRAIAKIKRDIIGDAKSGYTLGHPRFRDFLNKQISDLLPEYRRRVLDYCSHWPEHKSAYALTHYAGHLYEVKERNALYHLISKEWKDAKFAWSFNHQSFSQDIDIAIQAADEENNLPELVQLCLLYATLGELATDVPPEVLGVLARFGQVETALGYAALVQDAEKRIEAYSQISRGLVAAGEVSRGKAVLQQALVVAEKIVNGFVKTKAFSDMALALAQSGDREMALAVTAKIEYEGYKVRVLSWIAKALTQFGDREGGLNISRRALAAAEKIEYEDYKALVLSEVAQALAQSGDRERALDTARRVLKAAEKVEDKMYKEQAQSGAALSLTQVGEWEGALAAVEKIENEDLKAQTLRDVVRALVHSGDHEMALCIARQALLAVGKIGDAERYHIGQALGSVALALAQVGDKEGLKQAMVLAEKIGDEDSYYENKALIGLAEGLAQIGDREGALAAADKIMEEFSKHEALRGVVRALVQIDDRVGALAAVERIEDKHYKSLALGVVAQALAQAGYREDALEFAMKVLVATENIKHEVFIAQALSRAAQALAYAGDREGALHAIRKVLKMAEKVNSNYAKAEALKFITQALVIVDDSEGIKQVLAMVEMIEEKITKTIALVDLGKTLAQSGKREEALAMVEKINYEGNKLRVLSELAKALAQSGDREGTLDVAQQALEIAEKIEKAGARAQGLSEAAQALAQSGDLERAVYIARQALGAVEKDEDEGYKEQVLSKVAQTLAQSGDQVGLGETLAMAEKIEYRPFKVKALSGVAQAMAQFGDQEGALAVAEKFEYEGDKVQIICGIIQALAKAGDREGLK